MAEAKQNKDEQIGFHKGSVSSIVKERQELARLLTICDQLLAMHVKALKDLGVDITKAPKGAKDEKIEELIK